MKETRRVTAVLDLLFNHPDTQDHFIFKGGTSLSKVYGVIHRFSEDIDLIMDWRLLGVGDHENDPWDQERSRRGFHQFAKKFCLK